MLELEKSCFQNSVLLEGFTQNYPRLLKKKTFFTRPKSNAENAVFRKERGRMGATPADDSVGGNPASLLQGFRDQRCINEERTYKTPRT